MRIAPPASTSAMFCTRNADASAPIASAALSGRSTMSVTVPLTRGSTMKARPVKSAMARATASISVLAKLSVTRSCAAAGANSATPAAIAAAASTRVSARSHLRMLASYSSGIDREQHLVAGTHAEHAEQPVERAPHVGLGRRGAAEPYLQAIDFA